MPAFTQEKVSAKKGFVSTATKNWEEAKAGKSLVVRYRLKSDKKIQVDVRSVTIPAAKAEQYFITFHNNLINSGMKKGKSGSAKLLKGKKVIVSEYEMKRKKVLYNVLVYELHKGGTAWLVLAVTPAEKRKELDKQLPELLKGFTFP